MATEGGRDGDPGQRNTGGLFGDLSGQVALLLRQELALLKAELTEKLGLLGIGIALVACGGLLAGVGMLYLLLSAMFGLALVLPLWAAALAVGLAVILVGAILGYIGARYLKTNHLVPDRTLRSLRADAEWLRGRIR
ncbi:MAG TPA: phage holin family protein [Stellaceae bacterium]|nr:phage holin family protein [Stellaceae bacterium]